MIRTGCHELGKETGGGSGNRAALEQDDTVGWLSAIEDAMLGSSK